MVAEALVGTEQPNGETDRASHRQFLVGEATSGAAQIRAIVERMSVSDPPVPGLLAAFESLVDIHFDFRLQSFPLLYDLNLDMRPVDSDQDDDSYPPNFPPESTSAMYRWLEEEFIQYSYRVKSELRDDASRQFKVLAGAAVVLEDEVIRSGSSVEEFRSLAASYRDELWPGRFEDVNARSARGRMLQRSAETLLISVNTALGVN